MPISVKSNIETIEQNTERLKREIEQFEKQIQDAKDEILRLEGCMIVYKGFESIGLEEITLPAHIEKEKQEFEEKMKAQDRANPDNIHRTCVRDEAEAIKNHMEAKIHRHGNDESESDHDHGHGHGHGREVKWEDNKSGEFTHIR